MKMYETPHPLADYLSVPLECGCGRTHYAPLRYVQIGEGAIHELPGVLERLGKRRPYLICDAVTYQLAGERCGEILRRAGVEAAVHQLSHVKFDEATLGELLINVPRDCDIAVAVGSGSINDMTRYFSFKLGLPFMTVATAAPMDGFASSIAALQVNRLKTTFEAQTPAAILGDTEILKRAPYPMIAAGLGDLLGKSTCLCDWKLARLINGEHYCPRIVELVESCVQNTLRDAGRVGERDPEVLGGIMEGLVLTGVAMSLYGNSRPASGCEHHMSHYWEMIFQQQGRRPAPHGTQVGVGTILVLRLTEALRRTQVDFGRARAAARAYDPAAWEREIHAAYGPAARGIIRMELDAQKNETRGRLRRIDVIEEHWDEVLALLEAPPSSETVAALLRSLHSPCLPEEIGVDEPLLRNTLLYCKEVRARYTILQMLWDLGVLEELSEQVIRELRGL